MQTRNRGIQRMYEGVSMKQYKQLNLIVVRNTALRKGHVECQVKEGEKMRS